VTISTWSILLKIIVSGSFADQDYQARFEARSRIPRYPRGASDDVKDIGAVPSPFTPACDGHPLAPIAGPILVRDAELARAYYVVSTVADGFEALAKIEAEKLDIVLLDVMPDLTSSTVERHRRG
jgi:hypothetical protein